jgi:hypothetical protein
LKSSVFLNKQYNATATIERGGAMTSMVPKVRLWALLSLLPILCGTASAAEEVRLYCRVPNFKLIDGGDSSAFLYVKENTACGFRFGVRDSARGDNGILAVEVAARPKHGMLGKQTLSAYAYKPDADFKGTDSFDLKVRYDRRGDDKETVLHVTAYVGSVGGY